MPTGIVPWPHYSKRYRGRFKQLATLDVGNKATFQRPPMMPATEFRRRISNAICHLTDTRGLRFESHTSPATGSITVQRVA